MTSIITNTSAMSALSTLRSIGSDMEKTQSRISSGLKVESASDNAAYWSIATTMRSDNKALGAVQDALGLGAAKADVTTTAMEASIKVVDDIKAKLVAASEPGVDRKKIDKEIAELQSQLRSIAKSASFSGENWVHNQVGVNTAGPREIVGSFNRDANGAVSLTTLTFDTTKTNLISVDTDGTTAIVDTLGTDGVAASGGGLLSSKMTGINTDDNTTVGLESILTLVSDGLDADTLNQTMAAVDVVLQKMTDNAADVGALGSRINMQEDFVQDLTDSIEKGVGKLIDADMNEESTRLKALQTQQQLGIQALSIANNGSQSILSLFQQ